MFSAASFVVLCIGSILAQEDIYPNCRNKDNGEIIQNDAKFTLKESGPCIEYTCKNGGYKATSLACSDYKTPPTCTPVGGSIVVQCNTKVCKDDDGIGFKTTETKCEGDDKKCYSPGQVFVRTYSGKVWKRTTCTVNGTTINYQYHD